MSIPALIDKIAPYAKGWNRTGNKSILDLIQQGQDELFDYDSPSMLFYPTDNEGYPPYLKTVDGTFRYDIKDANLSSPIAVTIGGASRSVRCRRVERVFIDSTMADYTVQVQGEPYAYNFPNQCGNSIARLQVANIPMRSFPALESTDAYVQLLHNPGTTADKYFVEFVWEPPRLTGEGMPLVIPQTYEKALMRYVLGEIQFLSNAKPNELQQEFELIWKPRFRAEMGYGVQLSSNETTPRLM